MKVKALRLGYYNHKRQRPGVIFDMKQTDYAPVDKDGKPILDKHGNPRKCAWVELVEDSDAPKKGKGKKPSEPVEPVDADEPESQPSEDVI